MEELIPVRNKNGELLVSARDLHKTLKIEKAFSTWIQSQLESIDAVENVDFIPLKEESTGGRPSIEYVLKLDTAKEICMVVGVAPRANSETKKLSKQVRKYFIDCEKRLKTIAPSSYKEAVKQLLEQLEENERLEQQNNNLRIQLDESKDYYSIKRVAFLNNISWKTLDWRKLKRESNFQGRDIVKIFDANYGEVNTYHRSVWEAIYPNLILK